MKGITKLSAAILAGATAISAYASDPLRSVSIDSLVQDHKIIYVGNGQESAHPDSIRSLVERFYYDQYRSFQDPAAPYFLFMSRDANLAMGLGGVVRMRGYFDPGNSMPTPGFNTFDIPMGDTPLNRNHFGTTPAGTALFFRVIGRNAKVDTYQLYIQAKFNGYGSRDFKLSKAYAQVGDWTIGLASSTFSDGSAEPPVVDANGTTMSMDFSAVLIRYLHTFKKSGISIAASVETPEMSLQSEEGVTAQRSTTIPNFAAMIQWEWARDQHIRLTAITRFLPYRDLINNTNHTPVGYGLQLSPVFNPTPSLTVDGMFNGGRSYSNAGGEFLLSDYDLVTDPETPGRLKTLPGYSYYVGLGYHFSHKLFSTVQVGQGRTLKNGGRPDSAYRYGLYGAANVFYNLTPRIMVGAEFNFGKRCNIDGSHRWARRIGAMCQFSF